MTKMSIKEVFISFFSMFLLYRAKNNSLHFKYNNIIIIQY